MGPGRVEQAAGQDCVWKGGQVVGLGWVGLGWVGLGQAAGQDSVCVCVCVLQSCGCG